MKNYTFPSSFAQITEKSIVLDILPTIATLKTEIFIRNIDDPEISWNIFIKAFSTNLWLAIIICAVFMAISLRCIALTSIRSWLDYATEVLQNFHFTIFANLGGKQSLKIENNAKQVMIFCIMLTGSIVWMAYRASITSELSVMRKKIPFTNLEELLTSNYRYS